MKTLHVQKMRSAELPRVTESTKERYPHRVQRPQLGGTQQNTKQIL